MLGIVHMHANESKSRHWTQILKKARAETLPQADIPSVVFLMAKKDLGLLAPSVLTIKSLDVSGSTYLSPT